jgi:RNA polymerase sigma-70 factor (ECF subfamily)
MDQALTTTFEGIRTELTAYLNRLVVRPQLAEDLAQTAFVRCWEAKENLPERPERLRAFIFKVATNLALDELRRHSTWRETMVFDLRAKAESAPDFLARSQALIGTPETKAIAREHLAACFACTLRNLPERKAAALLLKEVHGFSLKEAAELLDAGEGQVKNWLQEARAAMHARYRETCALIAKKGVCHQCVELDGFFHSGQGNPLPGSHDHVEGRLRILKELRAKTWSKWHRMMFELIDALE